MTPPVSNHVNSEALGQRYKAGLFILAVPKTRLCLTHSLSLSQGDSWSTAPAWKGLAEISSDHSREGQSMVGPGRRASDPGRQREVRGRSRRLPQDQRPHGDNEPSSSKHIMCRQIHSMGTCSWGDKCWFAHDRVEQEQGLRHIHLDEEQAAKQAKREAAAMNWPSEREMMFATKERSNSSHRSQTSHKHRLCPHLAMGRCTHGDACWYSHSFAEQQAALGHVLTNSKETQDHTIYGPPGPQKDQLCLKFGRGACTRGDKCWFAHSLEEQRAALRDMQAQGTDAKESNPEQTGAAAHSQSQKHLPCRILKMGKACTLGVKVTEADSLRSPQKGPLSSWRSVQIFSQPARTPARNGRRPNRARLQSRGEQHAKP
ncbi:hypothetical protein WJX84_006043 [Apatococcus fuscideae]|uniref:C3H1-type domain-containing protein n=1 Tax=Apatococcus fuscideae TaxID=2026836 RepID=A0AAW1TKS6_9CHLO